MGEWMACCGCLWFPNYLAPISLPMTVRAHTHSCCRPRTEPISTTYSRIHTHTHTHTLSLSLSNHITSRIHSTYSPNLPLTAPNTNPLFCLFTYLFTSAAHPALFWLSESMLSPIWFSFSVRSLSCRDAHAPHPSLGSPPVGDLG